jgi:hypothetical protein
MTFVLGCSNVTFTTWTGTLKEFRKLTKNGVISNLATNLPYSNVQLRNTSWWEALFILMGLATFYRLTMAGSRICLSCLPGGE